MVKLPDDPRPVPAGTSAMLLISSRRSSHPSSRSDSRISGCLMSSIRSTSSICEYLRKDARHESMMHQDVDVFVDGRGDEEAAVLLVVRRQVGSPAAEGDAQRASGHDHGGVLQSAHALAIRPGPLTAGGEVDSGRGKLLV